MFSGIIAAVGQITHITPRDDGAATVRLTIDAGNSDSMMSGSAIRSPAAASA
jgi:riboflavin synthase alpha subunit